MKKIFLYFFSTIGEYQKKRQKLYNNKKNGKKYSTNECNAITTQKKKKTHTQTHLYLVFVPHWLFFDFLIYGKKKFFFSKKRFPLKMRKTSHLIYKKNLAFLPMYRFYGFQYLHLVTCIPFLLPRAPLSSIRTTPLALRNSRISSALL